MATELPTMYRAKLEESMSDFINSICEDDEWADVNVFVSADLYKHMAHAAAAVLDQAIEGQAWLRAEGCMDD